MLFSGEVMDQQVVVIMGINPSKTSIKTQENSGDLKKSDLTVEYTYLHIYQLDLHAWAGEKFLNEPKSYKPTANIPKCIQGIFGFKPNPSANQLLKSLQQTPKCAVQLIL